MNSAPPTQTFTTIAGQKTFYKQFKGTIGTQPITLNLTKSNSADEGTANTFSGFVYYESDQKPMRIYGISEESGNINLDVWSHEGNESFFNGKQNADGIFAGTWADTVSMPHKSLPFSLRETYDNHAIAFDYANFIDSSVLFKGREDSPKALFMSGILTPVGTEDKTIAAFLNKCFLTTVDPNFNLSDTTPMDKRPKISYPNATAMNKAQCAAYFKDYLQTMKDEKPGADYNLNYNNSSIVNVIYNADNLLSIAESSYTFTGGAHGMDVTTLSSYQLQNRKKLTLDDIFKPDYQPVVVKLLETAVRKQLNIKPNESLNSALFVDKMEITDNFAVTQKGILFLYNADEIASHAQGEFSIFIPFADLKGVLKM